MSKILERSVAYVVNVSIFGVKRKVRKEKVELTDNYGAHPDDNVVGVTKKILESKELDAIRSLDRAMRDALDRIALPSPLHNGIYLIPTELIERVDKLIEKYKVDREILIDRFIEAYQARIDEAQSKLNGLFEWGDYPSAEDARSRFKVESSFIEFGVPSRGLSADIYTREQENFQKRMQESADEIQLMLRETMKEMVDHMVAILTPSADGKYKKFYETSVTKLMDFLKDFSARNITDDADLEALVNQAKSILSGVDIESLRNSSSFKENLQASMSTVKESLNTLVVAKGRKFSFDE
jgi:hypothetical protein